MLNYSVADLPDLKRIAPELIQEFSDHRIFVFVGEMGAGKTTFIKALCEALGCKDEMNSPTFSLVNEYVTGQGGTVYHFDMYRLNTQEEALDMGFEEYLESGSYCFIEWPDKVSDYLPDQLVLVRLTEDNGQRTITAKVELM